MVCFTLLSLSDSLRFYVACMWPSDHYLEGDPKQTWQMYRSGHWTLSITVFIMQMWAETKRHVLCLTAPRLGVDSGIKEGWILCDQQTHTNYQVLHHRHTDMSDNKICGASYGKHQIYSAKTGKTATAAFLLLQLHYFKWDRVTKIRKCLLYKC